MEESGKKWGFGGIKCLNTSPYSNSLRPMFIGEYSHTLDEKGRITIPKKYHSFFALGGVVTRGLDHCLFFYTRNEWENLAIKLASLPFAEGNNRAFTRLMLAGAMDVEMDKQGRITLPEYLRAYSGLKKDIVLAGLYNRLEIWDASEWKAYREKTEAESNEIAEKMGSTSV